MSAVAGRRKVRKLNLDGDGQGDLTGQGDVTGQGGVNRAVMVYRLDSYRHWESELGRKDLSYRQFGGTSLSMACRTTRYASVTAFESTRLYLKFHRCGRPGL